MSKESITRLKYAMLILLFAGFSASATMLPLGKIYENQRKNEIADRDSLGPIYISDIEVSEGTTREYVLNKLGQPTEISDDQNTYYYYRILPNHNKDQVVVIKFNENDKVVMVDTNFHPKNSNKLKSDLLPLQPTVLSEAGS